LVRLENIHNNPVEAGFVDLHQTGCIAVRGIMKVI